MIGFSCRCRYRSAEVRVTDYFDPDLSHDEITRRYTRLMKDTAVTQPRSVRDTAASAAAHTRPVSSATHTGHSTTDGSTGRQRRNCLTRERPRLPTSCVRGKLVADNSVEVNVGMVSEPSSTVDPWQISMNMDGGAHTFPAWLRDDGLGVEGDGIQRRPNLSGAAQHYLERIGAERRGAVPSRPRGAARSGVPGGERGGAQDGVASHPDSGLAGRR